ncbi:oligosaccharide flippase family protein [uncultured Polaribacter sp.]|uniref:oligosaccharide flippase family protein n=1 Tax=uncultured Polaribacter sp. TaxID=174711 RepID=UPI0026078A1F|nr:oligosaccharide flippase family protein [uncultured Polaribacter sp.]
MVNKIVNLTKTVVFKNFSALLILQLGNTALALLLMPYLINILGVGNYGLYSFAFAISMYLVILTDYGFGFTGVKLISIHRDNKAKVSAIFHSIQIIKIVILIAILIVYALAILFVDALSKNSELFFLSFGVLIGQTIVPVWFFQGMEKMKFITIINLMIRLIAVILILLFVKTPEDINLAIASQAIGFSIAGLLSIYIAYSKFDLKFSLPKTADTLQLLSSNRHMFFSTLSLNLYKNFNVVLLGFLSTNVEVGIYSAVEKIIKAVQSLIAPMSQAIYPNISLKFSKLKPNKAVIKLFKIATYYIVPLFIITIGLLLFKNYIKEFLGIENNEFYIVFYILLPVIILGTINYLLGIIGLVNLNKEKWFNKATIIGGLINLSLCFLLSKTYGAAGSAIALIFAELIVLLIVIGYLLKIKKAK